MKTSITSCLLLVSSAVSAQPLFDIALFPVPGDSLEIRLRPDADFNEVMPGWSFTVRWPDSSLASLGNRRLACPDALPVSPSAEVTSGGYKYRTFSGFSTELLVDWGCEMYACQEHVVLTIPVINNENIDEFELSDFMIGGNSSGNMDFSQPCLSTAMDNAADDDRGGLLLFPNPATRALSITWPRGFQVPAMLDMVAADGRIVRSA